MHISNGIGIGQHAIGESIHVRVLSIIFLRVG